MSEKWRFNTSPSKIMVQPNGGFALCLLLRLALLLPLPLRLALLMSLGFG